MLKVGDLYRQQLRVHAWRFWNGLLPAGQAAMMHRTDSVHGDATWTARAGIALTTRDHWMVGYRVPREWSTLSEGERKAGSLGAFKRGSRAGFLAGYGAFVCGVRDCRVCLHGG